MAKKADKTVLLRRTKDFPCDEMILTPVGKKLWRKLRGTKMTIGAINRGKRVLSSCKSHKWFLVTDSAVIALARKLGYDRESYYICEGVILRECKPKVTK
jgi:hypothetical protein